MNNNNNRIRADFEEERELAAISFDGTLKNIGGYLDNIPVIVVFDNQSDVSVPLYVNSVKWKTFKAGQALVLDLRSNSGMAGSFGIDVGTQFKTDASAGTTGSFLISIINAR